MNQRSFVLAVLLLYAMNACPQSHAPVAEASIIGFFEQRDLELSGSLNQSHQGVITKLGQPNTIFGQQRLAYHFTHPTADMQELERRQAAIREIYSNTELAASITPLFEVIKKNQSGIEFFLNKTLEPSAQHILDTYYFSASCLQEYNDSELALTLRDIFKKFGLFAPTIEHVLFHFALDYIQQAIAQDKHHKHHKHHKHEHHGHKCMGHLEAASDAGSAVKGLFLMLKVGHFCMHAVSIYEMVTHIKSQLAVLNDLYVNIAAVRQCLENMHALAKITKNHAALSSVMPAFDQQTTLAQELIDVLNGGNFELDQSLGFFSAVGPTLRAYTLLRQLIPTWQPLLATVGDLDAYVSMAQLIHTHDNQPATFSFVRFKNNNKTPCITMKGAWNIMLNPNTVVTNDITLGSANAPSMMVITGPNKAGKSSILKTLGLNIVLAQSFGIVAAHDAEMSPFDALLTYMTVTDDISSDSSLMVAEMARADACLKTIQNLQPGTFACALIDDSLFKGTTFTKGQELAHQFIKSLGRLPQACGMVATHTALLTQLAQQDSAAFANFYIPTVQTESGKSKSTFTLVPGISNPDHVLEIVLA